MCSVRLQRHILSTALRALRRGTKCVRSPGSQFFWCVERDRPNSRGFLTLVRRRATAMATRHSTAIWLRGAIPSNGRAGLVESHPKRGHGAESARAACGIETGPAPLRPPRPPPHPPPSRRAHRRAPPRRRLASRGCPQPGGSRAGLTDNVLAACYLLLATYCLLLTACCIQLAACCVLLSHPG